jgi:hypothetical protein
MSSLAWGSRGANGAPWGANRARPRLHLSVVARRSKPRDARITERDRGLLAFVAEHRLVLAAHVGSLLGVSDGAASARLHALAAAGYVSSHRIFDREPACHQITRRGLDAIGSDLRAPRRIDLRCYEHDVGAAWLWLAAHAGRLGPVQEVLGERRLRSADARAERAEPLGVPLGGTGANGAERLHYPDLLLLTPGGGRLALELELTAKGRLRRETIIAAYAADARIDSAVYLVRDRAIGRAIRRSARRLGVAELVRVRQLLLPDARAGRARAHADAARLPRMSRASRAAREASR